MEIEKIKIGGLYSNCYIVSDPQNNEGLIIDPGDEAEKIIGSARHLKIKAIVITHSHHDHCMSAPDLAKAFNVPVFINEKDEPIRIMLTAPADFSEEEFKEKSAINILCEAINADAYETTFNAPPNTLERLNELIEKADFYEAWLKKRKDLEVKPELKIVIEDVKSFNDKKLSEMSAGEKKRVKLLNRLLIEYTYPEISPKSRLYCKPADHFLKEGDQLTIGRFSLQVLCTPGHTAGSICLYDKKTNTLFSGDTLYYRGHGRCDLPTGSEEGMKESLKRLMSLPPETTVYPGHGPSTTIGNEKKLLSFWQ